MSSNAIAAVAVVLVSGFAGCAATAKAEPVAISAPMTEAAPLTPMTFAPLHTVTITIAGASRTLHC